MIVQNPDGSSTAYMMGDPVPGIDISLEQVPGGIRIPVKGWNEYISEVRIKEEGLNFAEVRVVRDAAGVTTAYLMGDPVPGIDISLEQVPGGVRIPLKGADEYRRAKKEQAEADAARKKAKKEQTEADEARAQSSGSYLVFNWLPPAPLPAGVRVTYSLRIVELHGSQSPIDAMRSNPAFFHNANIVSTIYRYPVAARNFEPGRRYAWKVDVYMNGVSVQESETREFGFEAPAQKSKHDALSPVIQNIRSSIERDGDEQREDSRERSPERSVLLASANRYLDPFPLQERERDYGMSPLVFSGQSSFSFTGANRQASFSEIPKNSWTWEINPTLSLYGLPFTASVLLSSQQESNRQSINSFGLNFDLSQLQGMLTDRLNQKADELEQEVTSTDPAEIERMRDPSNLAENLDRYNVASGTEKFFTSVRTLGIGTTYPNYSEYTLSGVPVTGLNVELNPGLFYVAFAGMQNQRPIENSSYRRSLYAGRLGLGQKEDSHIYFTGMYVKDDVGSIGVDPANNTLTPQANHVFGTEAKLILMDDKLTLEGEGAVAVLTRDTRDPELESKSIPGFIKKLVDPKISTSFDYTWSGKLAFNNDESGTRVSAGVKMVGPGYTSLGAPNIRTDQLGFDGKVDQKFLERRVSVGVFFKRYKDNLINWKPATTTTTAYGVNLGLNFRNLPFLRLGFTPYFQKSDAVDPRRAVNNRTMMYSVTTGYTTRIDEIVSASTISYNRQVAKGLSPTNYFGTTSITFNEAFSFSFPLTVSGTYGLTQSKALDLYGGIVTVDLNGSYQWTEGIQTSLGGTTSVERNNNKKVSVYAGSMLALFEGFSLDVRAEHASYTDWRNRTNNYDEFVFNAGLVAAW
ncbi:MAG: hypothetical protein HY708_02820 [Ignavibacteriae bacterium]|nr:hypothetical protein [Ignavibacteriota bacterium]